MISSEALEAWKIIKRARYYASISSHYEGLSEWYTHRFLHVLRRLSMTDGVTFLGDE
jgi:hypothetical protein